ncbi:hypothetical protein O0L34_g3229 [Tuta absoluta]|nr:hypothetical protein O0L34_g3229 [Tuta absoluta]
MMSTGGTASELRYQASSERDYGSLTCLTKNTVGGQNVPCIFQIVPATRPFPPRNCTVSKVARHMEPLLAIRCEVGFDGGTRQYFTLETTGNPSRLLVNTSAGYHGPVVWLNVTWSVLEDIPEDQDLVVTAHNSKGPSEPVIIEWLNFRDPIKKIVAVEVTNETRVPVAVALIALAALLAIVGASLAYICNKRAEIASATAVTSKRPSQSVVQVDSQGRKYMFTYPGTSDKDDKPDILLPKTDNAPPRVVLESSGDSYVVREVRPSLPPCRPEPPAKNAWQQAYSADLSRTVFVQKIWDAPLCEKLQD